jgi:hypothetical protein
LDGIRFEQMVPGGCGPDAEIRAITTYAATLPAFWGFVENRCDPVFRAHEDG